MEMLQMKMQENVVEGERKVFERGMESQVEWIEMNDDKQGKHWIVVFSAENGNGREI